MLMAVFTTFAASGSHHSGIPNPPLTTPAKSAAASEPTSSTLRSLCASRGPVPAPDLSDIPAQAQGVDYLERILRRRHTPPFTAVSHCRKGE